MTRIGWRNSSAARMEDIDVSRETTALPVPPWRKLGNLTIQSVQLGKKKEEYSKEELRTIALEQIESIHTEYKIYTNGSTDANQENGGAGIYIEGALGTVVREEFSSREILFILHRRMCRLSQSAGMDSTAGTDQGWTTEHTGELGQHVACSSFEEQQLERR